MLTCDWPFRFHLITGDPCVGGSETGCVNMLKYGSTVLVNCDEVKKDDSISGVAMLL